MHQEGGNTTSANFTLTHYGSINGTVQYAANSTPIENATATIVSTGQTATTNASGVFTFSNVEPGLYSVTVSYPSYYDSTKGGMTVTEGTNTQTPLFKLIHT